ncbi:glutamine synthetase, catalytic domain protein [Neorickettsia helminthoeca str. Oregon]|uniref:Glutamine synthetase, catalytic domain protein n=1 Tax=Neorickettsia helminthoeca str. Oregon TaxID=1286528 RepID=X5H4I4_9RICK|nr:glutamine synthetase [Neorickettsia helminthoeca]AHX11593.1 glutamine synthetase, catalytic domain protein [Neorickettsia helminthoeca str. Oregon]
MSAVECVNGKIVDVDLFRIDCLVNFRLEVGVELEFYSNENIGFFQDLISRRFNLIERVVNEIGEKQYEISTIPTSDLTLLVREIEMFRKLTKAVSDFSSKPRFDQPGSAMHIHISLHDKESSKNIIASEAKLKLFIIGGMCSLIKASMLCFAPEVSSYRRFQYHDKFTPRFVNWGFEENKSNAIRITKNTIEHRVAGSDADLLEVIKSIIGAIEYGISNEIIPGEPNFKESRYSDSFKNRIPLSYSEASLYRDSIAHNCEKLSHKRRVPKNS